jgi:uncharacterized protein (TIGR02246 family)
VAALCRIVLTASLCFGWMLGVADAGAEADREAITARLRGWAAAFNARDDKGVCDIFAKDLIATVPGALGSGHDAVCGRLSALLAKTDAQYRYSLDILEIMVSRNLAVVRVNWTLSIKRDGKESSGVEAGIDIFERQPDNRWSIARFIAFATTSELLGSDADLKAK